MAVTPAGLFSLPVDFMRKTIAGSSSFRTLVGAANATAALAFVHAFSASGSQLAASFFAVVEFGEDWARTMHAGGSNNFFESESSSLQVLFHQKVTKADDVDAAYEFTNDIGAIISDMEQLSGTAGFLDIQETRLIEGPYRPEEDEARSQTNGDFYRILLRVDYASV